jgi:type 1 glutamine amidotransferase
MITAATLQTLTSFTTHGLAMALHHSGYRDAAFKSARFLGMTNGGQFCYHVSFDDEENQCEGEGKVFLTYDTARGQITADY